jgi:hypothetical protein
MAKRKSARVSAAIRGLAWTSFESGALRVGRFGSARSQPDLEPGNFRFADNTPRTLFLSAIHLRSSVFSQAGFLWWRGRDLRLVINSQSNGDSTTSKSQTGGNVR